MRNNLSFPFNLHAGLDGYQIINLNLVAWDGYETLSSRIRVVYQVRRAISPAIVHTSKVLSVMKYPSVLRAASRHATPSRLEICRLL